jgi:hypothetical protein
MADAIIEQAKTSIHCPECKRLYSNTADEMPMVLDKCKHTFCRKCLVKLKHGAKVMCPLDYKISECDYVSTLSVNHDLLRKAENALNAGEDVFKKNDEVVKIVPNSLTPANFCGVNDYIVDASKAGFEVVELNLRGYLRQCLCLKTFEECPPKTIDLDINPIDLEAMMSDYYPTLERTRFCWRWALIKDSNYRVVTIEDDPSIVKPLAKTRDNIHPKMLNGDNTFHGEVDHRKFYWRWGELNGTTYRILTVES